MSILRKGFATAASRIPDKIHLRGLVFQGYHGVLPEETKLGQKFIVDATVSTNLKKAGFSDNVEDTINYQEIYHSIGRVVEGPPNKLIECVAEKIAATILQDHPAVDAVNVLVQKPHAPVRGVFDYLGVEIYRERIF